MKLTVLGATGGIGTEVVRQALRAGHQVTAVVRDPARLPVEDGALEKVVADVFDAEELALHVKGADAVVSALGPREGGPATVVRDGAAAVRWAMRETGVRRIVLVSAAGQKIAPGDDPLMRFVGKPIVQRVFRDGFADLAAMEEIIRQSGLDWTLVRPPRLS
ncbi:MAG: NAD(P)H-binding protein, partial [Catenulispora sp.]|nr:NAD(P)H-binding protein [Catenulispora sp.]